MMNEYHPNRTSISVYELVKDENFKELLSVHERAWIEIVHPISGLIEWGDKDYYKWYWLFRLRVEFYKSGYQTVNDIPTNIYYHLSDRQYQFIRIMITSKAWDHMVIDKDYSFRYVLNSKIYNEFDKLQLNAFRRTYIQWKRDIEITIPFDYDY